MGGNRRKEWGKKKGERRKGGERNNVTQWKEMEWSGRKMTTNLNSVYEGV